MVKVIKVSNKVYSIDDLRNTVLQGHVLDVLQMIPDESVDMVCTSSPFWGLRDYGLPSVWWSLDKECKHELTELLEKKGISGGLNSDKVKIKGEENFQIVPPSKHGFCKYCGAFFGQLGLEPTFELFIDHLMMIFREIKRVLKPTGTVWCNIGDTYYGGGQRKGQNEEATNFGLSTKDRTYVDEPVAKGKANNIQNKSLVGIPGRFMAAMVDDGWICRNDIIWHKPNTLPSPVKDRYTKAHEYWFFFTKKQKYFFKQQLEPIAELNRWGGEIVKVKKDNKYKDMNVSAEKKIDRIRSPRSAIPYKNKNYGKYQNQENESQHREGMHKDRGQNIILKRKNLPNQKEFVDTLREKFTIDEIHGKTNIPKTTVEHWFRYDLDGFAYPSKEDWSMIQWEFNSKLFPELLDEEEELDDIKNTISHFRNQRTIWEERELSLEKLLFQLGFIIKNGVVYQHKDSVWSIPTKSYKMAHFATFNRDLIHGPIDAGCPKFVCKKCGKPRETVYTFGESNPPEVYEGRATKDYKSAQAQNPSDSKRNILNSKTYQDLLGETLTDCGCNEGFKPGIVLDPFFGSGTTGKEAYSQEKDFIGIELNPEYVEMSQERFKNIKRRLEEYF